MIPRNDTVMSKYVKNLSGGKHNKTKNKHASILPEDKIKIDKIESILQGILKGKILSVTEKVVLTDFVRSYRQKMRQQSSFFSERGINLNNEDIVITKLRHRFNLDEKESSVKILSALDEETEKWKLIVNQHRMKVKEYEKKMETLKKQYDKERVKIVGVVKELENKILRMKGKSGYKESCNDLVKVLKEKNEFIQELQKKENAKKMKFIVTLLEQQNHNQHLRKIINQFHLEGFDIKQRDIKDSFRKGAKPNRQSLSNKPKLRSRTDEKTIKERISIGKVKEIPKPEPSKSRFQSTQIDTIESSLSQNIISFLKNDKEIRKLEERLSNISDSGETSLKLKNMAKQYERIIRNLKEDNKNHLLEIECEKLKLSKIKKSNTFKEEEIEIKLLYEHKLIENKSRFCDLKDKEMLSKYEYLKHTEYIDLEEKIKVYKENQIMKEKIDKVIKKYERFKRERKRPLDYADLDRTIIYGNEQKEETDSLKKQIERAKKIKNVLMEKIKEKELEQYKMNDEIDFLNKELKRQETEKEELLTENKNVIINIRNLDEILAKKKLLIKKKDNLIRQMEEKLMKIKVIKQSNTTKNSGVVYNVMSTYYNELLFNSLIQVYNSYLENKQKINLNNKTAGLIEKNSILLKELDDVKIEMKNNKTDYDNTIKVQEKRINEIIEKLNEAEMILDMMKVSKKVKMEELEKRLNIKKTKHKTD